MASQLRPSFVVGWRHPDSEWILNFRIGFLSSIGGRLPHPSLLRPFPSLRWIPNWGFFLKPQPPHTRQKYEQKYGPKLRNLESYFVKMFVHIFALYVGGGGHQCISDKHRNEGTTKRNEGTFAKTALLQNRPALFPLESFIAKSEV